MRIRRANGPWRVRSSVIRVVGWNPLLFPLSGGAQGQNYSTQGLSPGLFGVPGAIRIGSEIVSKFDVDLGLFQGPFGGPTWAPNRLEIGPQHGPEAVDKMTSSGDGLQMAPWTENELL